jgi:NAD(P)-dependent dehydrogenase (short-subunit alcohol dehydrogenase family)
MSEFVKTIFNLENKIAVITGGTGVLGSEMALGLLQAGVKVILLGTKEVNLKQKIKSLGQYGTVRGYKCNVLDEDNIKSVNGKILEEFNHIDILINAAGGHVPGAIIGVNQNIFDLKIQDFKAVTDLNLNGTILPTLIFGKSMADKKSGSIINVSSMATQRAITRAVGYSAAKAAVENFTRWMAVELAQKFGNGIRVNAIAPGFFITDQNREILTNKDGSLTERGKTIIGITPFKRFGEPEELVGTILWLASDASKFITGTIIPIDGGFSAFSGV